MSPEVSSKTPPKTLRGVFAPVLTPVHDDLSPDIDRWAAFCQQLLHAGCHGLCPFGTTSEANSFSVEERIDMLDQLVERGISAELLMPGTGLSAIPETVKLTTHAVNLGCSGALVLPPFYYKGVSDEGIFRAFAETIERVGDDRLRVYLYHIPQVSQVGFSLKLIERLITAYPNTVVGLKDSSGDWNNLHAILTNFPGFGTFTGSEKFLLQNLRAGGVGSINAIGNVIAPLQRRLYDNWQGPDAEQMQAQIDQTRQTYPDYPPVSALKAIVAHYQQDPAWTNLRPPLVELTEEQANTMLTKLDTLGVIEMVPA